MRIDVFCLFPEMLSSPFDHGIGKRARDRGIVEIVAHDIRDYTHDRHHTVDDYPFGGGSGMVLKPGPIFEAVESVKEQIEVDEVPVILLTPRGRMFSQAIALELAHCSNLMLICGRYEGVDERVHQHLATDELSVGDYVLSGGELGAMVIVDTVMRLIPGVLGSQNSLDVDSHTDGLLEYPQYTRPQIYRDWAVPSVLLSGNHGEIACWRRQQAILNTEKRRPDMLNEANLCDEERQWISEKLLNLG